jgi:hypothetical protein
MCQWLKMLGIRAWYCPKIKYGSCSRFPLNRSIADLFGMGIASRTMDTCRLEQDVIQASDEVVWFLRAGYCATT